MSVLVADIETNGFDDPNVIWMVGVLDYHTDEFTPYVGEEQVAEGLIRLSEADCIIGHYFLGYDNKHIARLTEGLVTLPKSKIIDTYQLSSDYAPKSLGLKNHKLATWGELFNFPKGNYKDFDRFDPAMIPYCERDCRITKKIVEFMEELRQSQGTASFLEGYGR